MAAPVEPRSIEQGLAVRHLRRRGAIATAHEPTRVAVIVESAGRAVDVGPQPDLGVHRTPEEHRLLDLAGAGATESLRHRRGLPVGTRAKRWRAHQALEHRALAT